MNEEERQRAVQEAALRRQAATITLPTDVAAINLWFRELQEPIILFGETVVDRRRRLGVEVAKRGCLDALPRLKAALTVAAFDKKDTKKVVPGRHAGGEHLVPLRRALTEYWYSHRRTDQPQSDTQPNTNKPHTIDLRAASMLEGRPSTSVCALLDCVAVSDRDGLVTLLEEDTLTFNGTVQLGSPCTHLAGLKNQFIASSSDGKLHIYSHDTKLTSTLSVGANHHTAHQKGNMSHWHPSGQYFVSCANDSKWHFWSVRNDTPLFTMHGHHPDLGIKSIAVERVSGALVATGGGDGAMRVWDVRVGKCILTASEHVQPVCAIATMNDGCTFITGGMDNKIVIWDLRNVQSSVSQIPAHTNCVTSLCPLDGSMFASTCLDGVVKLWRGSGRPAGAYLVDESSKLTGACKSHRLINTLYTCGFDRTIRLFNYG